MKLNFLLQAGITVGEKAGEVAEATGNEGYTTQNIIDVMIDSWYINVPLIILSVLAVYIFFERTMAINRALKSEKDFMHKIKDYILDGKMESAQNLCSNSNTPVARMIEKGISRIGSPMNDIKASIENIGKLELYHLEKNLSTLATIAGAAPMLGFLGTVIGMVVVFQDIREKGMDIEILSGGMMFAMLTTIVGLIVGILAYMAYNLLVARVSKVIHTMEAGSVEFFEILEQPTK